MAEIEKRLQPTPAQTEVGSNDMIQSTEEHNFEIDSESEEIQQETEGRKQSIVDAYQNRIDETEMSTNKSLDETFDTHIESEDPISEKADEDTVEIEINLAFDNDIKDEILKFLKDANEARHFTDIINHLSNVLPNIDPDDFMIELDQLEKSGKIEAGLVGGKLHYNLNSRSLG